MTENVNFDQVNPDDRPELAGQYPITAAWDDLTKRTMIAVRSAAEADQGEVGQLLNDVTATLVTGIRSALFQIEARLNDVKGDTPPIPGD